MNDSLGWGSNPGYGNDLQFTFSLKECKLYLVGVATNTITVPSSSEISALFQEYRIDSVEMTMFYTNNNSSLNSPSLSLPLINVAFDPNDANSVSLAAIQQMSGVRQIQLGNGADRTRTLTFKPRAAAAVYNGLTSGYMSENKGWINTATLDVPHYGVKVVYDPGTTPGTSTNIGAVQFYFKLNFSCRGVQ